MSGRIRRRAPAYVLVLLTCVAGCGGDDDEQAVREAIEDAQRAFVARDARAVCRALSPAAARHVGSAGHDAPTTCPRDVRATMGDFEIVRADTLMRTRRVGAVDLDGDRATATIELGAGAVSRVPLVKSGGAWRIDALYGDLPARLQRDGYR